ncbi:MAG: hypothetical protein IJE05_07620 [Clostridia bacterium]|nr:hypothetical protein [Clostridia bacterium]
MKNLLGKLMVVLFLMLLLINNSLLVVISSAIDEVQTAVEQEKVKPVYELNLEKYVNYALDEETKGLMIQANLKTGIEYEEGEEYKPLGLTGVILNLPKINDEYPQKVEVVGKSTKATNGSDSAKDFNYGYDSSKGELKIAVLNLGDDEGNLYRENIENARDEYTVIVYYSDACYSDEDIDRTIEINGKVQENLADDDETEITTEIKQSYDVNTNISGLISTNIQIGDIYDGFIDSNNLNKTTYRTEYTENLGIDIGYKEIADELKISSENSFVNDDEDVTDEDEIIYKSTKIYKQDVLDKLGEDGYLKIFNTKGDLLGEVNKDTETSEDGFVEFKYDEDEDNDEDKEDITEIVINLSKPLNLGVLNIQNTKQIKETMTDIENKKMKVSYNVEAINNVEKVDETTGEVIETNQIKIYDFSDESLIEIKESETKIDLSVDINEWTNNMQNDVIFTANLVINDNKYDLFKNPVIEIKLPSEVENVTLGDVFPLYGKGLNLKSANVIEKNSYKVIRIELEGTQSEYMLDSMITGSSVLIPASIFIKKDIASVETNIEMTYSNENGTINDYEKENKTFKETKININSIMEENEAVLLTSFAMPASEESTESDGLSTEMMATVGNKTLKNEDSVYEEQIIKYTAKVTNNTDSKMSNVKFVGSIPDGTTYVTLDFGTDYKESQEADDLYKYVEDTSKKEYSEIFSLEAHEEKEIFYEVKVNKLADENEKTIESSLKIYSGSVEKANYSIKNTVKKPDMSVELKSWISFAEENIYIYRIKVKNNKTEDIQNPHIELLVPNGFELTEMDMYDFEIQEEKNKIIIDFDSISANETRDFDLYLKINQTNNNVYEYNINTYAVVEGEGTEKYYSNENRQVVYMVGVEVVQTSEKEGKEVQEGEEIEYNFVIRNVTNENIFDGTAYIDIKDFLDENVEPVSAEYEVITYNQETGAFERETKTENFESIIEEIDGEEAPEFQYYSALPVGEEIKIKLKVKAGIVLERTPIMNNISIEYNDITKISNTIKNIIVLEDSTNTGDDDSGDNSQDNEDGKYSINGTAWIDLNEDGQISDDEEKVSEINVSLFNVDTNSIAKDEKNNNITAKTDGNGKYEFENVVKGNYLVVFEYDTNNYKLSTYKKTGVSEQYNSDVIDKELKIENDVKKVAVTDILSVNSKDVNNINIGLIQKQKFDLSLNKSVTKVTVKYDNTEKEKSYSDSKLAKVEVPARKMSKTTIVVEYKLEVKNEGDIDAYVNEIVDYVPETFEFDNELNAGWNNYGNGKLRNSELSGERIKPGESKSVTLYLTKNLTDSTAGIITNAAEITKSSNMHNATDIDSKEGNKNEAEDDYSEAQLIISVGTGVVTYTLLIIGLLVVFVVIRYLIDKKIISIKNIGVIVIILSAFGIIVVSKDIGAVSYSEIKNSLTEEAVKQIYKRDYADNTTNLKFKNYDSSTFQKDNDFHGGIYIHHDDTSTHGSFPNYLWCSDGRTQCGTGDHHYKLSGVTVKLSNIMAEAELSSSLGFYIENKTSKDDVKEIPSVMEADWKIVGPFQIDSSNTVKASTLEIKGTINDKRIKLVHGGDGNNYFEICNVDEETTEIIKPGKQFYVRVKAGLEIESIKLTIKKTETVKVYSDYIGYEKWKCVKIGGSHTRPCSLSSLQVMRRSQTGKISESISVTEKKSITIKPIIEYDACLDFYKIDNSKIPGTEDKVEGTGEIIEGTTKKIEDILKVPETLKVDNNVDAENYLKAGFAGYEPDQFYTLDTVIDPKIIEPIDDIQFIIARIVESDDYDPYYEYITGMDIELGSPTSYASDLTLESVERRRNLGTICKKSNERFKSI